MRWDFLISTQQNLFVIFGAPKELCSNRERKNDGALISIHRNPLAKSLLTIGILERPKGKWNHLELFGTREAQLEQPQATGTREAPSPLTLKCVNFVNFVNFWKEKSPQSTR